jgi:putative ABC transport system substrate-binding protein
MSAIPPGTMDSRRARLAVPTIHRWTSAIVAVVLFLSALTGAPGVQAVAKVWRIGYLDQGSASRNSVYLDGLREGLRELGWVEGRNITIEARFAEGHTDQLPALAAELVRSNMDVIVTSTTPAALAAKRATSTIPIVFGFAADPVGSGIVPSLAHPKGNVTGWTHQGLELRAKYLDLLKEAVPAASRIGVLWNPANQVHKPSLKVIEDAAQRLKVELYLVGVQDAAALETHILELTRKGAQGLIVFPDGMFLAQTPVIVATANRQKLPTMYGLREFVDAGGLMAYGTNLADMHRQLGATLVDKILKGASPATLPVAQPTKFELVINLQTAKTIGLTIPRAVLLRADRLIQ